LRDVLAQHPEEGSVETGNGQWTHLARYSDSGSSFRPARRAN
jgi:hypothetical protein